MFFFDVAFSVVAHKHKLFASEGQLIFRRDHEKNHVEFFYAETVMCNTGRLDFTKTFEGKVTKPIFLSIPSTLFGKK